MRKIAMLLLVVSIIFVQFLSGCQGLPDITGGATGASSYELCILAIIVIAILVVVLLVGLARAGTKKNITIHSPPLHSPPPTVIIHQEPKESFRRDTIKSERRCPECGHVIPDDAKLCPYCGKKFKMHYKEEESDVKEINGEEEKKEIQNESTTPKYCRNCGAKIEGKIKFCTNCGNKLI